MKKKITVTLGIIIILVAVTISGCTSDPNQAYLYKQSEWSKKVGAAMKNQQQVNQDFRAGIITSTKFINNTNSNKKTIDNVIAEMEKTTPPSKFKHEHELVLSAYKEYSKGLLLTMEGVYLNYGTYVKQATDLIKNGSTKIDQANKEVGNMTQRDK